jgi:hypothetical protein
LANVLIPALSAAFRGSSSKKRREPQPCQSTRPGPGRFLPAQSGPGGPPARVAPSIVGPGGRVAPFSGICVGRIDQEAPVLVLKPCRRLFKPSLPISCVPSYAEVVMAGVGGDRRGSFHARRGGRPGRQLGGRGGRDLCLRSSRCRIAVEDGVAVEGTMAAMVEGCQTPQSEVAVRHLRQWPPQLLSRVSRHRGRPAAPRNLLGVLSCPRSLCRKS